MSIDAVRRDYAGPPLTVADVGADPLALFRRWLHAAEEALGQDAVAMVVATVDGAGCPHSRVVLLRGIDADGGLCFYTNTASAKSRDLAGNDAVALLFHWPALDRQVRIEGRARALPREQVAAYFASRPLSSRIAATVAVQSSVIPDDRAWLERRFAAASAAAEGDVATPVDWGGYAVTASSWEFWQGQASRLHDRVHCHQVDGAWCCQRLA
ncbi:MAG: pyridoxamine 5'-phosphate oxidase, partial [Planctomycetota bacterium]